MIMKSQRIQYLALLSLSFIYVADSKRFWHRRSGPVVFPNEDPFACSTPLRQPGVCVPIERCPQLRRVGLRRLPKYICGFEHDTPLLCCETSSRPSIIGLPSLSPPPPPPPEIIRPEYLPPLPPNSGPAPVPLLCTTSERDGRRWKSCWYLALQRVDILEDQDSPQDNTKLPQHPSDSAAKPSSSGSAEASPTKPANVGGPPHSGDGDNPLVSLLGTPSKPSKTSVTSE